MKKITIECDNGAVEIIAYDSLKVVGSGLQYRGVDGTQGAVSLSSKITIEPYKEPGEWCVVFGLGSREFWYQRKREYDSTAEVMIKYGLLKHDAENMANDFNSTKECYGK